MILCRAILPQQISPLPRQRICNNRGLVCKIGVPKQTWDYPPFSHFETCPLQQKHVEISLSPIQKEKVGRNEKKTPSSRLAQLQVLEHKELPTNTNPRKRLCRESRPTIVGTVTRGVGKPPRATSPTNDRPRSFSVRSG